MSECKTCKGIKLMPAKVSNAGVLTPESTQQLEEVLGLEAGKFGFKKLTRYDSASRSWSVTLVIKEKGSSKVHSIDLGTL